MQETREEHDAVGIFKKEEHADFYWWFWGLAFLVFVVAFAAFIWAGLALNQAITLTTGSVCRSLCVGPCTDGTDATDGTNGTDGVSGALDFASFYATMPTDNPFAITPNVEVNFPTAGPAAPGTRITIFFPYIFVLQVVGTFEITYFIPVNQSCQIGIFLNENQLTGSITGRSDPNAYVSGRQIITTSETDTFLSLYNAGPSAFTVTPRAGGAQVASAHLTIVQIS